MTTQSMEQSYVGTKTERFLRSALVGNAIFSTLCALVLVLGSNRMAALLGVSIIVPLVVGVGLLPFAWFVLRAARRNDINATEVNTIIFLDAGWVVATVLLLVAGWRAPGAVGTWSVVLVADLVATFGALQWWGLRRVARKNAE